MPSSPPNPYIVGPPVAGANGFFGREAILQAVTQTLRESGRNSVILYGQRRIGKTSLLLQLERYLPSPPFFAVYVDLAGQALLPIGQVLYHLAATAAAKAGMLPPPPVEAFRQNPALFHETFLPALYQALGGEQRPVFLLDEFEPVLLPAAGLPEGAAVQALSAYIYHLLTGQTESDFIFAAGRRMDELSKVPQAGFQADLAYLIPILPPDEARTLILQAGRAREVAYDEVAVSRILALTRGHPELTQWVCYHLFERAAGQSSRPPRITVDDVEALIPELVQAGNPTLPLVWQSLPPAEQVVLAAIGQRSQSDDLVTQADLEETLARAGLSPENQRLEEAPVNLIDWQLLEQLGGGYTFFIEFEGRWVGHHRPLPQALQEVAARSNAGVEALYEAANQAFQAGDASQAQGYLRQALVLNPDYLPAQLLSERSLHEFEQPPKKPAKQQSVSQPAEPTPVPGAARSQPVERRGWWLAGAGIILALLVFLVCGQGYNPFTGAPAAPALPVVANKATATPEVASPTATTLTVTEAPASPTATIPPAEPSPTATPTAPSPTLTATAAALIPPEAATATPPAEPTPTLALSGQIRVAGSTSMQRLVSELAGAFTASHPGVEISLRRGGSQAGLEALQQGEAEVALVSWAITEAALGEGMRLFPLAQNERLAVVVHPLAQVESLSLAQLRAIFAGEITAWDEVGGPEAPIVVVTRPEGSGTLAAFEQVVMGEPGLIPAGITVPSQEAMRDKVSTTPYAIGYLALDAIPANPAFAPDQVAWAVLDTALLEANPLALDGVEPTLENANGGVYPLVRPFNLVTLDPPGELVQAWLAFIAGPDGQQLIERTGHLPAP